MNHLEAFLDELAGRIAEKVIERQRGSVDMIDQAASPLGNRRHCSIVKRRVAKGQSGASIVGRRHLLSRDALDEELARIGREPEVRDETAEALLGELRLVASNR